MTERPHDTTQLILSLREIARMQRQIQQLRARAPDAREHIAALEACRATLLRLATRGLPATPAA